MISSEYDLCSLLGTNITELYTICSNIDKYYRKVERLQKGKHRVFYQSRKRLRDIHDQIVAKILSQFEFPLYLMGGLRGRDNIKNALLHQGKKFKFQTDLKDFFNNITNKKVYNLFLNLDYSPQVARWLTKLTTYHGRLPQGVSTSSYIANLIFLPVDRQLCSLCDGLGITYSRFLDDITFSSSNDFKDLTLTFLHKISESGYAINHKKTHYRIKAIITGIGVKYKLYVPSNLKTKIEVAQTENNLSSLQSLISYCDRILLANKKSR